MTLSHKDLFLKGIQLVLANLLLFSCNTSGNLDEGFKYFKSFDYKIMKGVDKLSEDALKRPYVAVKHVGDSLVLKLYDPCKKDITENFVYKDSIWYGYSHWKNGPVPNNLKTALIVLETHSYILKDAIIRFQYKKSNDSESDHVRVMVTRGRSEFYFISDKINHGNDYDMDQLIKSSLAIGGSYSVITRQVEKDTMEMRVEQFYSDRTKGAWLYKYKLNGIDPFFINYDCSHGATELGQERI